MEKPLLAQPGEEPPLEQPAEVPAGKPSLQKPAEELSEEAQVLAATLEASLEAIMEDEALKNAKKEAFLKKVRAARKQEESFQAWAENCVSLLTEAHQAEAASVQLTGLGSCSRCRWGTGCSSCSFPHAVRYFLREELGQPVRPKTWMPRHLLQGGGLLSDV